MHFPHTRFDYLWPSHQSNGVSNTASAGCAQNCTQIIIMTALRMYRSNVWIDRVCVGVGVFWFPLWSTTCDTCALRASNNFLLVAPSPSKQHTMVRKGKCMFVDLVLARGYCWQYSHCPLLLYSSSLFNIILCLCVFIFRFSFVREILIVPNCVGSVCSEYKRSHCPPSLWKVKIVKCNCIFYPSPAQRIQNSREKKETNKNGMRVQLHS